MRVYQGEAIEGSEPTAAATAADLGVRIDDVVRTFTARAGVPVEPSALDALRSDILELARAHAARTVLQTITARDATRAAQRQRRPWGRRPQGQL